MPPPPIKPIYLISRIADPLFAAFIGIGAAATRINREEAEVGRGGRETLNLGLRYVFLSLVFGGFEGKGKGDGGEEGEGMGDGVCERGDETGEVRM